MPSSVATSVRYGADRKASVPYASLPFCSYLCVTLRHWQVQRQDGPGRRLPRRSGTYGRTPREAIRPMERNPKPPVSARWHPPERSPRGSWWTARIRDDAEPQPGFIERTVCGPDADACARETARVDRENGAAT